MKLTNIFWAIITFCAILIVTTAVIFLKDPRMFSDIKFASNHLIGDLFVPQRISNFVLFSHIFIAIPAFVIGPFMFHEKLRNKYLKIHRAGGTIYVFCAIGCGLTGMFLGLCNTQGIPAKLGFATLGCMLALTTWTAFQAAVKKKFLVHRVWMLRSYALMFAFFFVKFLFLAYGFYFKGKIDPDLYKQILSWACWIPNLVTAEIYIAMTSPKGKFVGWKNVIQNYTQNKLYQWKPLI